MPGKKIYHRTTQATNTTDVDNFIPDTTLKSLINNPVSLDEGNALTDTAVLDSFGLGTLVARNLVAGVVLAAGDLVGISGGRVVKADADTGPQAACGVAIKAAAAAGDLVDVALAGSIIVAGKTPAAAQWVGTTAGALTETENVTGGQLKQQVGVATTATRMQLEITSAGVVN